MLFYCITAGRGILAIPEVTGKHSELFRYKSLTWNRHLSAIYKPYNRLLQV